MSVLIEAQVSGRPRTKGSLRVFCQRNRAHTVHIDEDIQESKTWRALVALQLREAQLAKYGKLISYPGPVEVRLAFFFPRDESVNGGPIPTHDTVWPIHIMLGDADKLARNVLDALSTPKKRSEMWGTSALLADDSQVVSLSVGKFWTTADNGPGVQILVMTVEQDPEEVAAVEFAGWEAIKEVSA